jgi:hypothetical protein
MKHFRLLWLIVFCLISIASFLIEADILKAEEIHDLYCSKLFPGNCTQGGCAGDNDWHAVMCIIRCTDTKEITCEHYPI